MSNLSVRPADDPKGQVARHIIQIATAALDNGDEREALEQIIEICKEASFQKTNGHTVLTPSEQLRVAAERIVTALNLSAKIDSELLAAQIEQIEQINQAQGGVL